MVSLVSSGLARARMQPFQEIGLFLVPPQEVGLVRAVSVDFNQPLFAVPMFTEVTKGTMLTQRLSTVSLLP